jgi:hypothetical protein
MTLPEPDRISLCKASVKGLAPATAGSFGRVLVIYFHRVGALRGLGENIFDKAKFHETARA